jgi:hypothetical protein
LHAADSKEQAARSRQRQQIEIKKQAVKIGQQTADKRQTAGSRQRIDLSTPSRAWRAALEVGLAIVGTIRTI